MGIVNYTYNRSTSGGEIITHLINAKDGAGLHFDGAAGYFENTSSPNLGTKFSIEFIIQAEDWATRGQEILEFTNTGRFGIGRSGGSSNFQIYDTGWRDFGVAPLDDGKVHHLIITVDGTAAILYDNGNQAGTTTLGALATIDACSKLTIGAYPTPSDFFNGSMYRVRLWNKTLSQAEVTASYENATVTFADQYGSQTSLVDAAASVFTSGTYSWVKYGTNTIANVSNTLAITYGDNQYGAYNYLKNASDLTADLTVGKKYRLTLDAKYTGGAAGTVLELGDGASSVYSSELTTGLVNYIFEFTAQSATAAYIQLKAMAASNVVTIDNWYVREIGCVVDVDCAFSNPTQSLLIQDRAGAADGTSSATGVTQVTKIEAVNTNKLNVGGTTPLVGIGLLAGTTPSAELEISATSPEFKFKDGATALMTLGHDGSNSAFTAHKGHLALTASEASKNIEFLTTRDFVFKLSGGSEVAVIEADTGYVGVGMTPTHPLGIAGANKDITSGSSIVAIHSTNAFAANVGGSLGFQANTSTAGGLQELAVIVGNKETAGDGNTAGYLAFGTRPDGGAITERLRIDSAGLVQVGKGGASDATNPTLKVFTATVARKPIIELRNSTAGCQIEMPPNTNQLDFKTADNTRLTISNTGLTTVYNPGWPLKNELSNSGFGVWSNSTLENVGSAVASDTMAADATVNWAVDTGGSLAFDFDHYEATTDGTANLDFYLTGKTFTEGKLYKISLDIKDGSATADVQLAVNNNGSWYYSASQSTTGSYVTQTFVFESVATNTGADEVGFRVVSALTGNNIELQNFTVYEVTPGCVAANALGPDGWSKNAATNTKVFREHTGSDTKDGSFYSLKLNNTSSSLKRLMWPHTDLADLPEWYLRHQGRTHTFGAWVKYTGGADEATVGIDDSDGTTYSDYHSGGGAFEWLEVTRTSDASITSFGVRLASAGSSADETMFFSQPMLVFGSAIGSGNYSRPSGEFIWLETRINPLNSYSSVAVSSDAAINLEAESNGKIPKGATGVNFNLTGTGAVGEWVNIAPSATTYAAFDYFQTTGEHGFGQYVGCDSNGDIAIRRNGTLGNVTMRVLGVKLR